MTSTARTIRPPRGRTRRLFYVDLAFFALFVFAVDVRLTGLAVHEVLGIAIGAAAVVHLVQHIDWTLANTRSLVRDTSFRNKLNYVMLGTLSAAFLAIVVSGLAISEKALPWIGLTPSANGFWLWLHLASVAWVIWLTAVHLALNWAWIVNAVRRYAVTPLSARRAAR